MSNMLNQMLTVMSEEDRIMFDQLSKRLSQVNGDISQLSKDDLLFIQSMEKKYGSQIDSAHKQSLSSESLSKHSTLSADFLEMPFSKHVRQVLARHLGSQFPQEEEAVSYAFENRWIPNELKAQELIDELFSKFELDIYEANQWREDIIPTESDKKMAVGIAWFSVIYQLHQRFSN